MKILLTGANGQLGKSIQERIGSHHSLLPFNSSVLDITNFNSVNLMVAREKPDIIINAAAYTAVDKAESEPQQAHLVNASSVENLAIVARTNNSKLIHISTDYVFDGERETFYSEDSSPRPINVYGQTKLLGEQLALKANPDTIIIRTSWVFGEYGNNFLKTMLKIASGRNEIRIVGDQIGRPTYANDLADALLYLTGHINSLSGIYHYTGSEVTSWYKFAAQIFDSAKYHGLIENIPALIEIQTTEYPTPAKRPFYSLLDCSRLTQIGLELSDWERGIDRTIKYLARS